MWNDFKEFALRGNVSFLIVQGMNRLYLVSQEDDQTKEEKPTTKTCPYCRETIPINATRCPQCTSQLEPKPAAD